MTAHPHRDGLVIAPLGGCGEIGMNLTLYGVAGKWLMVDCGVTFEKLEEKRARKKCDALQYISSFCLFPKGDHDVELCWAFLESQNGCRGTIVCIVLQDTQSFLRCL